jgi:hypothetical protein
MVLPSPPPEPVPAPPLDRASQVRAATLTKAAVVNRRTREFFMGSDVED